VGILVWAHGMRASIWLLGQPLTSRVRVRVSQACGLTPLSLQVSMSEAMIAQLAPRSSLPANSAFFRFNAIGLIERSTVLLSISMRPSSTKRSRPAQWLRQ
jgi:hypothetical protein